MFLSLNYDKSKLTYVGPLIFYDIYDNCTEYYYSPFEVKNILLIAAPPLYPKAAKVWGQKF